MQIRLAKNGKKYKVYAVVENKTFTLESFPLNEKVRAKRYMEECKLKSLKELGIVVEPINENRITFNYAFKEYFKSINNTPDLETKTKEGYIAILEAHIQPYINIKYLDDYKAADFKHGTKNGLLESKKIKNGIRTNEKIGKLVVQRALRYFKNFLIFCKDNQWDIEIEEILKFEFHPRQLENRSTDKDDWIPSSNDVYNIINLEKHPGKKAWIHMLAETGIELSAALGVCYDNVYIDEELGEPVIEVLHSLDGDSIFRPNYLKTDERIRKVQITGTLYQRLKAWMDIQINPATFARQYKRVFPYRKEYGADIVRAAAKRAGVNWKKGASPFRKFSASVMYAKRVLDDASFAARYGWNKKLITFKGFYQKPLSGLNKNKRTAALNNLITNGGTE